MPTVQVRPASPGVELNETASKLREADEKGPEGGTTNNGVVLSGNASKLLREPGQRGQGVKGDSKRGHTCWTGCIGCGLLMVALGNFILVVVLLSNPACSVTSEITHFGFIASIKIALAKADGSEGFYK